MAPLLSYNHTGISPLIYDGLVIQMKNNYNKFMRKL
jgi:hypothetical protein